MTGLGDELLSRILPKRVVDYGRGDQEQRQYKRSKLRLKPEQ
jgi:hypothetical protein